MERERMWFKNRPSTGWEAIHGFYMFPNNLCNYGETMLIAAMRVFVASKFGNEVD
jgi:hypothetical protein